MSFPTIWIVAARKVGAGVLGLGVLWQVAEHAGWGEGEVVVHVAASGVSVQIDGDDYPYEPWPASPIVCTLRPGTHTLTMTREGQTLHDQTFALDPNGQVVLTAWDNTRPAQPQKHRLASE